MIAISLADVEQAAAFLCEISSKDSKWDAKHQQSLAVANLYLATELSQYAVRMGYCAPYLGFAEKVSDDGTAALKLHSARFCRCRLCPTCQWRRSLMWVARFKKALPQVLEDYPKLRFVMLTLTVTNCPLDELRQTVRQMNQAWQRLTQLKVWPAVGFIKSVEVTRSRDGQAHPHIHAILAVRPDYFTRNYLSHAKWVELWKNCLRVDYTPVVNIKVVKPKAAKGSDLYTDQVISALVECVKYSTKDSDLMDNPPKSQLTNAQWLEGLTEQLLNTRAVSLGGILREYLSEQEPEDLIHEGDEETEPDVKVEEQLTFGWRQTSFKYVLIERKTITHDPPVRSEVEHNTE